MTRRDVLVTIAAVAAVPSLHMPAHASPAVPTFTAEEMAIVARLVDIIIPRTDTPGASDAGVHLYLDRKAGEDAGLAYQLKQGLSPLRRAKFADLAEEAQVKLFVPTPLFQLIKNMTIDGYYATREGLVTELGYHGNTYVAEWVGCTHPEHQWNAPAPNGHAD